MASLLQNDKRRLERIPSQVLEADPAPPRELLQYPQHPPNPENP